MRNKRILTLVACGCMCLAIAQSAFADFVGVKCVNKDDPLTDDLCTQGNGDFVPGPLTVCNVYANFDLGSDRLQSIGNANLQVSGGGLFYQHPFGGNTSTSCALHAAFPDLACDSFATIGWKCDPGTDGTTTDPDFDDAGFNGAGHVGGGWFSGNPPNGQGDAGQDPPNQNLQVLFLQLSVEQGRSVNGDLDVFWLNSAGEVISNHVAVECVAKCTEGQGCDDGNPCTENDECIDGTCTGEPIDCSFLDDGCIRGQCVDGVCVANPIGEECDDGNTEPADCVTDFCEPNCTGAICSVCALCEGEQCENSPDTCHLNDRDGHGADGTVGATSDLGSGFTVADNFTPETDSVTEVCWRGIYIDFGSQTDCGPGDGDNFTVTYYTDNNGLPGAAIATHSLVGVQKIVSGFVGTTIGPVQTYGFTATHPAVPVTLNELHWIEIVNDTTGSTCRWLWSTAAPGDALSAQDINSNGYEIGEENDYDLAFCLDSGVCGSEIIFVDANAGGLNNGTSWDDAFTDLQDALDAASSCSSAQQIWVASANEHEYKPSKRIDPGDARSVTFQMLDGVRIIGGLAGNEDPETFDLEARNFVDNKTILSGEIGVASIGDNAYHVATGSGTDDTAVLDGFTVERGNANGTPTDAGFGGGLLVRAGSPRILNCRFEANSAFTPGLGGGGAGMAIFNVSSPEVKDCVFLGNDVPDVGPGGGVFIDAIGVPRFEKCQFLGNTAFQGGGVYAHNSSPVVEDCVFTGNSVIGGAGSRGGGMFNTNNANPVISGCTFTGNSAPESTFGGGGIANDLGSSPILSDCTFVGNSAAAANGGGMHNDTAASPTLTDCTFIDNSAATFGGGIYNGSNSDATLTGCTFIGNSAPNGGGGVTSVDSTCTISDGIFVEHAVGGALNGRSSGHLELANLVFVASFPAVYVWPGSTSVDMVGCTIVGGEAPGNGAAINFDSGNGTVTNTLIVGNAVGTSGAAVRLRGGAFATITNCTIAENQAGGFAGGIWNESTAAALDVVNSILWQNSDGGGANTGESAQITSDPGSLTISFCEVQDDDPLSGNVIDGVSNNLVADPLFLGGPSGTWTADAVYCSPACADDPLCTDCTGLETGQTRLTDANAHGGVGFADDELAGKFANPDIFQALQSLIVGNSATEIVVWGDFSAEGTTGATYQVNDYHLGAPSPAIDSADSTAVAGGVDTDLDGLERFVDYECTENTGVGDPPVDMGAYEFQLEVDCNCNGLPDDEDVTTGIKDDCDGNGEPDSCDPGFGVDGSFDWVGADGDDFSFVKNWTPCCGPGAVSNLILSNTSETDNSAVLSDLREVCSVLVEASGSGRQIVQIDASGTLILNDGMTLAPGGDLDMQGGVVTGGLVTNNANTIAGFGTIESNMFNEGSISGASGETLRFTGDLFDNQPSGMLRAPIGSVIHVTSPTVMQTGHIEVRSQAVIAFDAELINGADGLLTLLGGTFGAAGLTNDMSADLNGFGAIDTNVTNNGDMTVIADMEIVGDVQNEGTITIQNGLLTITGNLSGSGVIIGDFGGGGSAPVAENGLTVIGDYALGASATLQLADTVLKVGGDFDVAINDNANYDMIAAELRMVGLGEAAQALEIMSVDIGPDELGLDRTLAGHYPIRTLRIGPTPTIVNMVDAHDNDGLGQASCEAIYVENLIIESGARLNTLGCPVYYVTLTLNGEVDDPKNLIELGPCNSACVQDIDGSGDVRVPDLIKLLSCWGPLTGDPVCACLDIDTSDDIRVPDLIAMLAKWGPCS